MKLHQLSLFIENKPGQIKIPCQVLANANINIITLTLADTEQFGILRLIVKDWQKAKQALETAGCIVKVTEVLAIDVNDRPGGLAEALEIMEKSGLTIEYMYAFTTSPKAGKAVLIFRFEDADAAIQSLKAHGINALSSTELCERVK